MNTCRLHGISMIECLINDWFCPQVNRNAFIMKYSRWSHECTLPFSRRLRKSLRSLMNAFLRWIYWMNNSCSCLAFVFRKIGQERTPCKMTWPERADWHSKRELARWLNWISKIISERAFQNIFSTCSPKLLWYNMLDNLTWQRTHACHSNGDWFMLFVVYCLLCARAMQVIRWLEMHAFEDKPTKYGKQRKWK